MITIYICPDCRCEHDAPAEAGYLLYARCFDCAHLVAIAEVRAAATLVTSSRGARDGTKRSAVSVRDAVVRRRPAA